MTCYFCGDATEDVVETDLPLNYSKRLEYKKIGICKKKRCQKKLERRLNKRLPGPEKSKIVPLPEHDFQSPVLVQDIARELPGNQAANNSPGQRSMSRPVRCFGQAGQTRQV